MVVDRWHKTRPLPDEPRCREHDLVPTGVHGRSHRWQVRWRDETDRQRKKSFAKKSAADRFETKVKADLAVGAYVDPSDRTTVTEYAHRWMASRPHRPTTRRVVESLIDNHIAGTPLGGRRLAAVLPSEVQSWATGRAAALGPVTTRHLVSLLRSIFAAAALDRLVGSSPVVRVALPPHERARVVPLTVDEVRRLAETMPDRYRALVITQAGLGLRVGELIALRLQDVNFLGRTVRIETQIPPGSRTRTEPKTPRSRRVIPLPQVVANVLAAHIAAFPAAEDGTLFTTRAGAVVVHRLYGSLLKAAVHKAGLPETTSSHDLRHHYASVLLHAGESVVAVAERLGHQNANLVLTTYGHLMPDSEGRTRKAIDSAWSAPDVPQEAEDGR
jgi:integrase